MTKSHVSMEQQLCIVCGDTFDTGAVLLDKKMRPNMGRNTLTGWGMCETHQALKDANYIALIGCNGSHGEAIKPSEADRTGRLAHVRLQAFNEIFSIEAPEHGVAFVEDNVITLLEEMV